MFSIKNVVSASMLAVSIAIPTAAMAGTIIAHPDDCRAAGGTPIERGDGKPPTLCKLRD